MANAQAAVFTGVFSGANEAPGNASPATGEVTVTIDEVLQTMLVEMSFSGLAGTVTAAHLHCCSGPGVNASVATQTPSFIGFPSGVASGSYSQLFDLTNASTFSAGFVATAGSVANASDLLIASLMSGLVYANIHTTAFPGGEIRADLVRASVSEVPLPAALWLFLAGAAPLYRASRKRLRP